MNFGIQGLFLADELKYLDRLATIVACGAIYSTSRELKTS